jgi:hypothetical protein
MTQLYKNTGNSTYFLTITMAPAQLTNLVNFSKKITKVRATKNTDAKLVRKISNTCHETLCTQCTRI